jgi:hypothetical protein
MIATIVGPGVQPIALISLACHNDDGPCWLLPLNLYILGFLLGMAQYKIFNTLAPGQRTTRSTDSVSQPPPTGFGGCGFVIFSFSYIFLSILQKYMVRNFFLQNYTSSAVGDGDRDLPPCPTALGARAAL